MGYCAVCDHWRVLPEGDICERCQHRNSIHGYHRYWTLRALGGDILGKQIFAGIEIEVAHRTDDRDIYEDAATVRELYTDTGMLGDIQSDGSIHGSWSGFEIIYQPMTWEHWRAHLDEFFRPLDWLRQQGYRPYASNQCGMHIHLSKHSMTRQQLWVILQMLYRNYELTKAVCRREDWGYCNPNVYDHTTARQARSAAEKEDAAGYGRGLVNIKPDTVEIRGYRASLNRDAVTARIQHAFGLCHFAIDRSMRETTPQHFLAWLKTNKKTYPHLHHYLAQSGYRSNS